MLSHLGGSSHFLCLSGAIFFGGFFLVMVRPCSSTPTTSIKSCSLILLVRFFFLDRGRSCACACVCMWLLVEKFLAFLCHSVPSKNSLPPSILFDDSLCTH